MNTAINFSKYASNESDGNVRLLGNSLHVLYLLSLIFHPFSSAFSFSLFIPLFIKCNFFNANFIPNQDEHCSHLQISDCKLSAAGYIFLSEGSPTLQIINPPGVMTTILAEQMTQHLASHLKGPLLCGLRAFSA